MTSFLDQLQVNTNRNSFTENGAVSNDSTLSAVLDFFALAGAMRDNSEKARTLFRKAYAEDRQLAVRALFYLRDIRGGQGERDLFRFLFKDLVRIDPVVAADLLQFIPEYGRWDDVVSLYGVTGLHIASQELIREQLFVDNAALSEGQSVSLLAKWLPSENASSANSRVMARQIAEDLGLSNKEYRQRVVALRQHIGLLEQQMSEGEWGEIDYGHIPSQAARKHSKAFNRHDGNRFEEFLGAVVRGEATMNAGTLFTYEVFDSIRAGNLSAANAQWASLPDYTNGDNALVVADVSGSMYGRPMDVSVSLALYFAEHNTGPFHDYFLTFSERPQLVKVQGNNLAERLRNIQSSDWGMNTNIEAVFKLILKSAISSGADATDMPKTLYIISDMEFDSCVRDSGATNFENARAMFANVGYELPTVVFWNVNARSTQVPATKFDSNVTLISGLSQSTFQYAVQGKSPLQSMQDVLNSERYSQIVV